MYYIEQVLSPYLYFGTYTPLDCSLDQPVLVSPDDGANVCPSGTITPGLTGVEVEWEAVPGADFYLLQICLHDQFAGPGFKSIKIAAPATTYEFTQDELRYGETWNWRIWAYSNSGCTSPKSESRTLAYQCDLPAGGGSGGGGSGDQGHSSAFGDNLCERYAVKVEVEGPDRMFCCDLEDWFGRISYNCKDGLGNDLITLNNTSWESVVEPGGVGKITITPFFDKVNILADCHVSQKIKITFVAEFTEIATAATFECKGTKRITINCDTSTKDKPWLQPSPYMPATQVIVNNTTAADQCDVFDPKQFSFNSDVFISAKTGFSSAAYNLDCCRPSFSSATYYNIELSAFSCQDLGCGLIAALDETLQVNPAELFGLGFYSHPWSDSCKTSVYPGCGLKFGDSFADPYLDEARPLEVDIDAMAGPGLHFTPGGCELYVYTGCGLNIFQDRVYVDTEQLFAEGFIEEGGSAVFSPCGVSLYLGCGLKFGQQWDNPGGVIKPAVPVGVDLDEIAGKGIYVKGCALHTLGGNFYGNIYQDAFPYTLGCGLGSNGTELYVEPRDLFHWGFRPFGDCGVDVYLDCTLEFGDSGTIPGWGDVRPIRLNPAIAGKGLYFSNDGCILHAEADGEFPYSIGCGLELKANTLAFDAWDAANHGIEPLDPNGVNCEIQALLGCGLFFDRQDPRQFTNDVGIDKFLYPIRVDVPGLAGNGLIASETFDDPPICSLSVKGGYCISVDGNGVNLDLGSGNSVPSIWLPVVAVKKPNSPECVDFYVNLDGLCSPGTGEWGIIAIYNGAVTCLVGSYCNYCSE